MVSVYIFVLITAQVLIHFIYYCIVIQAGIVSFLTRQINIHASEVATRTVPVHAGLQAYHKCSNKRRIPNKKRPTLSYLGFILTV